MNTEVETIAYSKLVKNYKSGRAVIIDVREPAEFFDGHINGAINLAASKFNEEDFQQFGDKEIYLMCQSGSRATSVANKLSGQKGLKVFVSDRNMEELNDIQAKRKGWSIDRQFRFILGLFIAVSLIGFQLGFNSFLIIPFIICSGLIVTAIIDKCYLRVGIAMLPWNKYSLD